MRSSSRDPDAAEEHLVERRPAGHLLDRADLDAVGESSGTRNAVSPACLGTVGIGAADGESVLGDARGRGPHLLPVEHPLVAVARRPCTPGRRDRCRLRARRTAGSRTASSWKKSPAPALRLLRRAELARSSGRSACRHRDQLVVARHLELGLELLERRVVSPWSARPRRTPGHGDRRRGRPPTCSRCQRRYAARQRQLLVVEWRRGTRRRRTRPHPTPAALSAAVRRGARDSSHARVHARRNSLIDSAIDSLGAAATASVSAGCFLECNTVTSVVDTRRERRMDLGLAGKKAIVTGSTKGIGRAIAETLLDEGASVAICARDADGVAMPRSTSCAHAAPSWGSAGRRRRRRLAPRLRRRRPSKQLGGLDIYVHNTSGKPAKTLEAWQNNMDIDLMALVARRRRRHGGARAERRRLADQHRHVGRRRALRQRLEQLQRLQGGGHQLDARPGAGARRAGHPLQRRVARARSGSRVATGTGSRTPSPSSSRRPSKTHPMGTIGDVDDVANAVVFLASPARQAHQRCQPHRRRRLHEARRLLTIGRHVSRRHEFATRPSDRRRARRRRVVPRLRLRPTRAAQAARRARRVPGPRAARLRGLTRRSTTLPRSWSATRATCGRPTRAQRVIRDWVEAGGRWLALHGTSSALDLTPDGWLAARRRSPSGSTRSARSSSPIRRSRPYRVDNVAPDHWLVAGVEPFEATDELYLNDYPDRPALDPVAADHLSGRCTRVRRQRLDTTPTPTIW